jgi:hypothetical protein
MDDTIEDKFPEKAAYIAGVSNISLPENIIGCIFNVFQGFRGFPRK